METGNELVKNSLHTTFEEVYRQSKAMVEQHQKSYEKNGEILSKYADGIAKIKTIELHDAFKKEGKNTLMDIYHDEQQMDKWRNSCTKGRQALKEKVLHFEGQVREMRPKMQEARQDRFFKLADVSRKQYFEKAQTIKYEKTPLIVSLMSAASDDLLQMHKHLDAFVAASPKE